MPGASLKRISPSRALFAWVYSSFIFFHFVRHFSLSALDWRPFSPIFVAAYSKTSLELMRFPSVARSLVISMMLSSRIVISSLLQFVSRFLDMIARQLDTDAEVPTYNNGNNNINVALGGGWMGGLVAESRGDDTEFLGNTIKCRRSRRLDR